MFLPLQGIISGAGAGATLAFHALDDDGAGNFGGVITGTGSLTTTHASTIYAQESSGQWNAFTANKPVISGGVYTDEDNVTNTSTTYLDFVPAATNSQIQSSDLTNVEWTAATMTTALDATGLDGGANKASTLTATGGNSTVLANAITSASNDQATNWYIKRKTGTGVVEITVDGGTTWTAVTLTTSFVKFTESQAAVTNPQIGIRIVTSGDAVIVGNAESYLTKTAAEVKGSPPIFTTTAAVSTDVTQYSFSMSNYTDDHAFYVEISGDFADLLSDGVIVGYNKNNLSGLSITSSTDKLIYKDNISITNGSHRVGTSHMNSVPVSSINLNGVWETEIAVAMNTLPDAMQIGSRPINLLNKMPPFRIRNLRIYSISSFQEGKDKIDELMI